MAYLRLKPLEPSEAADLALRILKFFALNGEPSAEEKRRKLGLPELPPNCLQPFSVGDFLHYQCLIGADVRPLLQHVQTLLRALASAGFLIIQGQDERGWVGEGRRYLSFFNLSTRAASGALWLGQALGASHVADRLRHSLVWLTGTTTSGDAAAGSGCHVLEDTVLTCAHVVEDMRLDEAVSIGGRPHKIRSVVSDSKADVAVVKIHGPALLVNPDLCFREPQILEEVLIAGYPTVPLSAEPVMMVQRGEICGLVERPVIGPQTVLFSAIARPGNSGGPVVSLGGQIVGMVSRSLERSSMPNGTPGPLPFFAAVAPGAIRESFARLTDGESLPWEDYS